MEMEPYQIGGKRMSLFKEYRDYDTNLNMVFNMCEDVLNYDGSTMEEKANAAALRSMAIDEAYRLRNGTIKSILERF